MRFATVCKTFQAHAAHQLPNHNGKCRNLHGHTYRIDVAVFGPVHAIAGVSDDGMVIDFDELKAIWATVEKELDHAFLNDTLEVPTAERIAAKLFDHFESELQTSHPDDTVHMQWVRVWETPTSYAEVNLSDVDVMRAR